MTNKESNRPKSPLEALEPIRDALDGLRFGNINVIVQDSIIVQIDRTEKRRLSDSERKHHVIGS